MNERPLEIRFAEIREDQPRAIVVLYSEELSSVRQRSISLFCYNPEKYWQDTLLLRRTLAELSRNKHCGIVWAAELNGRSLVLRYRSPLDNAQIPEGLRQEAETLEAATRRYIQDLVVAVAREQLGEENVEVTGLIELTSPEGDHPFAHLND